MKQNNEITKLVTAALLAALTCISTLYFQFKVPIANGGYIHPGDAFVLLSGILLGPVYGGLSAGVGSMLADLLSGYVQYAPATFVIKLLAAMIASLSYHYIRKNSVILAGIFSGFIVTLGYFVYEGILTSTWGSALKGVPFNLVQNFMAIVIASALVPLLKKVIPRNSNLIVK